MFVFVQGAAEAVASSDVEGADAVLSSIGVPFTRTPITVYGKAAATILVV